MTLVPMTKGKDKAMLLELADGIEKRAIDMLTSFNLSGERHSAYNAYDRITDAEKLLSSAAALRAKAAAQ